MEFKITTFEFTTILIPEFRLREIWRYKETEEKPVEAKTEAGKFEGR
jgi:hypothetical protein